METKFTSFFHSLTVSVIVCCIFLFCQTTNVFAQSGQKWSVRGNNISTGNFLGTKNNQALLIKVNNALQLTIKTDGLVKIEDRLKVKNKITTDTLKVSNKIEASYLSGNGISLLQANNNGVIKPFLFPSDTNTVLFGSGNWKPLPPDNGWQVDGNNMYAIPTGNVGIGIYPTKKLDVNGSVLIRDSLGIGVSNPQAPLDVQGDMIVRGWIYAQNGVVVGKRFEGQKVQTDTIESTKNISKISETDTLTSQKINVNEIKASDKIKVDGIVINGPANKIYSTGGTLFFNGNDFNDVGTVRANSVETDNLHVSYTDFDSLHVTEKIKIGLSSLYLSSHTDVSGTENSIYTENGDLLIQSNQGNANNTIINQGDEGFVGIGTDAPQKKLHIRSFVDLSINPGPGLGSVRIEDEYYDGTVTKPSVWDIEPMVQLDLLQASTIDPSAPVKLNIGTPGAPVMTLTADGKVGIGTQDPQERLQIEGQYAKVRIGYGENYLKVGYNAAHAIIESHGTDPGHGTLLINWYSGNNVVVGGGDDPAECTPTGNFTARHSTFLATVDGKVGIGTTNPQAKLDIVNDNNLLTTFQVNANTDDYSYSMVTNVINEYVKNYVIKYNGNETFCIYGNGMVEATDVWVSDYSDFPDYVFGDKYNLMNIRDLDTFIKINRHLPEIPSANKVSENGVSLKEMNTLLLKKVEELTLYIIDLQKQINELKEKK